MKEHFGTKRSGLLRFLLLFSVSEKVMEMLYDESRSSEQIKNKND